MRRTKWPLPPHEVRLEACKLLTSAELYVNGRLACSTSLSAGVTLESDEVKLFVAQYFHLPTGRGKPRKRRRVIIEKAGA